MTTSKLAAWLRQPTTIHGIAGLVGTLAATVAGVLTHNIGLVAGAGTVAFSVVAMAMPDNTAAAKPVQTFAEDLVTAIVQQRIGAAVPVLASDALAVVRALTTPAAVTTPPVAGTA